MGDQLRVLVIDFLTGLISEARVKVGGIAKVITEVLLSFDRIQLQHKFWQLNVQQDSITAQFNYNTQFNSSALQPTKQALIVPANTHEVCVFIFNPTSEAYFSVCDFFWRTESEAKGRTESVVRVRRTLSNAQTTDRVRGPSLSLWSDTLANSP
ncbi:hypothetical protein LXL04_034408 [Taraxacum kok-saghyz]